MRALAGDDRAARGLACGSDRGDRHAGPTGSADAGRDLCPFLSQRAACALQRLRRDSAPASLCAPAAENAHPRGGAETPGASGGRCGAPPAKRSPSWRAVLALLLRHLPA